MIENQFKTFEAYVKAIINNFKYEDFSPDGINVLGEKLKHQFTSYQCYWQEYTHEDKWPKWLFFLKLKSYKSQTFPKSYIGFLLKDNLLHIATFDNFQELHPGAKRVFINIKLEEIWMNHEVFFNQAIDIFQKAIEHANRENQNEDALEAFAKICNF